jgi:hypothetical protein
MMKAASTSEHEWGQRERMEYNFIPRILDWPMIFEENEILKTI